MAESSIEEVREALRAHLQLAEVRSTMDGIRTENATDRETLKRIEGRIQAIEASLLRLDAAVAAQATAESRHAEREEARSRIVMARLEKWVTPAALVAYAVYQRLTQQ
jgi:hypothetical protein